jgi:hypothetical protein
MMQSRTLQATIAATAKTCGHARHVGTCGSCQRAQLAKWQGQLAQVQAVRRAI